MNGETTRDLLLILVMAMVTFATRLLPFLLFDRGGAPKAVLYLGRVLPPAIMAMLIVYCLKGVSFATPAGWVPALLSCGAVVLLHLWKGGTICSPSSEGRSCIWPWSRACLGKEERKWKTVWPPCGKRWTAWTIRSRELF